VARLEGKVAIVTGAARGIGEALARLFVAEGAKVAIADVRDDLGQELARSLGKSALYLHLDVTSETEWEAAVAATRAAFGNPTVLINNAGIYRNASLENTTPDDYMQTIRVNQLGTFLGMRSVVASMRDAGGGSIVNISSTAGLQGQANAIAYVASKYAVRGMTKTAALELAKYRIRVNSVHPGGVATPLNVEAMGVGSIAEVAASIMPVPLERWATAEEMARFILFVASEEAAFATGSEFVSDGGLTCGRLDDGPRIPGRD
jgi:3alpha(or 20beta)-hydroxysteroid dehydrogenase